ncbi:MAG: sensory signal transduction histidine kinase with domain [Fibrobacteres bacterium]|nr:sensory signal transduction histidine kinase with domain [Fibrobacterota bacterium]
MANIILQVICSFLFAVGLLFILLDIRTRFDRSFRFFGVSLILLCAMTAIDIWLIPNAATLSGTLFWQRAYHGIACIFIPFSLWYLCILTNSPILRLIPTLIMVSSLMAAAFLGGLMIIARGGQVHTTLGYNLVFLPYVVFYVVTAHYVILKRINKCAAPEKRILRFHLAGFAVLIVGGLLDIGILMGVVKQVLTSFTVLGVLAFGIMASLIFAERFLMILLDRQTTFDKLESAYRDLEQVTALKQLGESTAIINHEIKNYMFMISGNAQILQEMESLSAKGKDIVKNIVSSVERLTDFSDDILKLSRTEVIREKHPVNLPEIIKGSIEKHFPDMRASFTMTGLERDRFMFGDWGKLEQVFVNIFNNSIEAGNGDPVDVKIKLTATDTLLLVGIEDNGVGCDESQLENLFKAFYTTKKLQGGTGLGMSITRTIVESHGGRISAYSKNLAKRGEHGLKLIMTFPIYAEKMAEVSERKHPIVVVKDGLDNLADLIRVFRNLRVTPAIVSSVDELDEAEYPPETVTLLVSAKAMASHFTKLAAYPQLCLVSNHERNQYVLDHGRGNRPEVFSEEYVVSRMLRRQMPRVRLKERQHHLVG